MRRNARRQPRYPARFPRQPRQRSISALLCARHRTRQLQKYISNLFLAISVHFVLECRDFIARIFCGEHYFQLGGKLVYLETSAGADAPQSPKFRSIPDPTPTYNPLNTQHNTRV
jgi:hypothetical protein